MLEGFARGLQIIDIHVFGADCALMNAIVQDNIITMVDGRAGIKIQAALPGAQALHSVVIDNVVQGSSCYDFRLRGDPGTPGSTDVHIANHVIIDNNFKMLPATEADFLLDAFTNNNHVVAGAGDAVIDDGTDNEITPDNNGDDYIEPDRQCDAPEIERFPHGSADAITVSCATVFCAA